MASFLLALFAFAFLALAVRVAVSPHEHFRCSKPLRVGAEGCVLAKCGIGFYFVNSTSTFVYAPGEPSAFVIFILLNSAALAHSPVFVFRAASTIA